MQINEKSVWSSTTPTYSQEGLWHVLDTSVDPNLWGAKNKDKKMWVFFDNQSIHDGYLYLINKTKYNKEEYGHEDLELIVRTDRGSFFRFKNDENDNPFFMFHFEKCEFKYAESSIVKSFDKIEVKNLLKPTHYMPYYPPRGPTPPDLRSET